ncbi:DUF305 domain-containing protein [Qaidamihabitans albus]|uniref:DUF305 domain-containing protein n=1 Tax=Qaidamihabitans albus TaxID=2795733 RepID=UPI0027DD5C91|nr:DUF305 domain-containing protein [Qaidamihabitans albus]
MSTETETSQPEEAPERPTWSRVLVFGAGTLAVLLIGATIGMLLTGATSEEPVPTPGADSVAVGFAQDMSVHHEQAVTMANWARDHSTDPAIRQLAFDMASTQLEQIGRMKGWLMLWGQPEQPIGDYMTWMSGAGGHAHQHSAPSGGATAGDAPMPGMATTEELAEMRSRSGEELDVTFLRLMLRHHQGGTDMAQYAVDHASVPAVRTLADSMLRSQGAEMDLMRRLLAERDAQPLPFP